LIPGIVNNFLRPIFGAGQGEAQKIDKTGQKKSGEVALTPRAKLDPNTLQPPPPLGSPDLKRALEHDSIEVPSPSDPVITVEWPTNEPNEVKLLKEALRAGDCALTLSEGGGDEVDKLSCAIGGAKTLFDAKVPPELEHQLLAHNCATSVIKLLTPGRAVHGLIGASMCSIEVGLELAEQPTKAPPGSLPPDKIKLPPNVGPIDIQGRH
jgi:hypothetical protein